MRNPKLGRLSKTAGALAATAAGIGAAQQSCAEVVALDLDLTIPPNRAIDFDIDGVKEFDLIDLGNPGDAEQITKVYNAAPGVGFVLDDTSTFADNLAADTLIDSSRSFSTGLPPDDALNGDDGTGPVGKFQVEDPAGFIGVQFLIGGNTHYGYVGFEGVEIDEANPGTEGRIFGIGYENTPNTGIVAGAGLTDGLPGDYNGDDKVDAADYVVWRKMNLAGPLGYANWLANFGEMPEMTGAGSGGGGVPEPTSLTLLAAGAAGLAPYRRRRKT